ncbi:hypothetical protein E2542_SST17598 [Spatholobus suberectus]|nr:hypothetical protein E2542_SST17598 [Spatholobus suberectus]
MYSNPVFPFCFILNSYPNSNFIITIYGFLCTIGYNITHQSNAIAPSILVPLDSFFELLNDNVMMQMLDSYLLEYLIKRIVILMLRNAAGCVYRSCEGLTERLREFN